MSNHLGKKTHKIRCISTMCTQNLFTIFAYGLLWPMHIEFPRQRTDLHLATKQLVHFVYYGQLRANTWHIELNIFGVPKNVRRLQCRLEILEILAPLIFPSDGCRLQNERNRLATLWVLYATPSCTLSQNLPVGPIVDRFPT